MTKRALRIIGAGGKDSAGSISTPTETSDSLRIKAHVSVLDLVSEGPIEGPAAPGLQWAYFNDTPVQNTDGSYNFKDVTISWVGGDTYGTQPYLTGFSDVEADTQVNTEVVQATPVVRTISDTNADAVRVVVQIPQMYSSNPTTQDIVGWNVRIAIDVSPTGTGTWVQQFDDTIHGKCMKPYERAYRVELTGAPVGGWDIRVRRISTDSVVAAPNRTFFLRYTKVIDKRFAYPNSAIVGVMANAAQFSNVPVRSYLLKLLKVKVPVNYDPLSRTYSGVWDGTWKIAWTDNPVWCWYDLCTNTRYGAGRWIKAANLDKWGLYTIAQYCDAYISAGKPKRTTLSATGLTLTAAATGATLTRSSGKWFQPSVSAVMTVSGNTFGFTSPIPTSIGLQVGDSITSTGFNVAGNNVTRTITGINSTGITVNGAALTAETTTATLTGPAGDGFRVGDEVAVAGFSTAANNGRARIASLTPTALTLDEKTLVNEGPVAGCSVTLQDFTEPRFSCNLYLQQAEEAINVIRNMASIFRAMVYLAGGVLVPVQDAPASPAAVFNRSNVLKGKFTYAGSGKLARHTVALVSWNDPNNGYKQAQEMVMDEVGVARYGLNTLRIAAMGCTSQAQANRVGRWALYSERLETETVSFGVGQDGAVVRPGDIINIHDTQRAGKVLGGRVKAYTSPTVTLDRPIVIEPAKTYTLLVTVSGAVASYTVTNGAGTWQTLTLSSPPGSMPTDAAWVLSVNDLVPTTWRVLSVTEAEEGYQVEALSHNTSKFAAVETGVVLQVQTTSSVPSYLPPQSIGVTEYLINKAGDQKAVMNVAWVAPNTTVRPSSYTVGYRRDNGEWIYQDVAGLGFDLVDCPTGVYDVRVAANYQDKASTAVTATYTVLGKTAPPGNVTGLASLWKAPGLIITWTPVTDLDLDHYELRQGESWAAGTPLDDISVGMGTQTVSASYVWALPTLPVPTIWVKAIDTTGHESATAASITPTNPASTFSGLTIAVTNTRPA